MAVMVCPVEDCGSDRIASMNLRMLVNRHNTRVDIISEVIQEMIKIANKKPPDGFEYVALGSEEYLSWVMYSYGQKDENRICLLVTGELVFVTDNNVRDIVYLRRYDENNDYFPTGWDRLYDLCIRMVSVEAKKFGISKVKIAKWQSAFDQI